MVPGFAPSADPMLQARMFAYPDASRYRLGVNYQFLPTNANKSGVWCPTQRDGFMNFTTNYGGEPNYVNTRISPVNFKQAEAGKDANGATERNVQEKKDVTLYQKESDYLEYETHATTFTSEVTEDDFVQPRALWAVMGKQDGAQERFVDNVVAHVADCERGWLREEVYAMFGRVDMELGQKLKEMTEAKLQHGHDKPHKTAWH